MFCVNDIRHSLADDYESYCSTDRFNLPIDDLHIPRVRVRLPLAYYAYLPFYTMGVSADYYCLYRERNNILAKSVSRGVDFQQIDDFEYE